MNRPTIRDVAKALVENLGHGMSSFTGSQQDASSIVTGSGGGLLLLPFACCSLTQIISNSTAQYCIALSYTAVEPRESVAAGLARPS